MGDVLYAVSRATGVPVAEIRKPGRGPDRVAAARHLSFYLVREMTGESWPSIGRFFGRHHPSVINGYRNIARTMKERKGYAAMVENIRWNLKNEHAS